MTLEPFIVLDRTEEPVREELEYSGLVLEEEDMLDRLEDGVEIVDMRLARSDLQRLDDQVATELVYIAFRGYQ